ncbi:BgTH12-05884 [Blumeria graminis f. sp. triticale]|nr:BgTH12-05884 [Blumeria graminis f. sp. triticale]
MKRLCMKSRSLPRSSNNEENSLSEQFIQEELGSYSPSDSRPSKPRKQKSRVMSLLSVFNSVPSISLTEPTLLSPSPSPSGTGRLFSATLNNQLEPTVVHRTRFRSRPSIISIERGNADTTPEISLLADVELGYNNSRLVKVPQGFRNSRFSIKLRTLSPRSTENCGFVAKPIIGEVGSNEYFLPSLVEGLNIERQLPRSIPTFVTVEKASSAKVFFECHYNTLTSVQTTARTLRRRQLEMLLRQSSDLTVKDKDEIRSSLLKDENEHLRHLRNLKSRNKSDRIKNPACEKYEMVKVLGKGSFGVVRLVREKVEGSEINRLGPMQKIRKREVFAMKVIKKINMLHNCQEGHLRAERDFLVAAEGSRWVVPLISSFQDVNNLYLVMNYMPGGDFLGLLIRENVLTEPVTKWYIAEMILCIEEAHALHWIHRDIKPDNFLISASGHLKISDFGLAFDGHWSHDQSYFNNHRYSLLAKLGLKFEGDSIDQKESENCTATMKIGPSMMEEKQRHEINFDDFECDGVLDWRNKYSNRGHARSIVGTSQYMAPEVCLYGHTPFLAEEGGRQQTKLNILNHKTMFRIPSRPLVSRKCQDLLSCMIQEKGNRLSSKKYRSKEHGLNLKQDVDYTGRYVYPNDAEEIKEHKWFRDIQWDYLHMMVPPTIPEISSTDDTRYFDEEDSISDFSESTGQVLYTQEEISNALKPFNHDIQMLVTGYISFPYDSARLKDIEREIDQFFLPTEQKHYLKAVVKLFGRREKKRPRDKLLRDKVIGPKVLEVRKNYAFLGYTYRRFRPCKNNRRGILRQDCNLLGNSRTNIWHRSRLSFN